MIRSEAETLRVFFDRIYAPRKLRGCSKNTRRLFLIQFRHFAKFLGREPTLLDLTDDQVNEFLTAHAIGRAVPTVNCAHDKLLALWRFAARKALVPNWPDVKRQREPERIPRAWLLHELDALLESCALQPGSITDVPANAWWLALITTAWYTAERIGALMALRWKDYADGWLTIPAEVRKGKTRDKLHRLPSDAIQCLDAIRQPTRELIFPWPYDSGTLYNHFKVILKRADLPTDRKSKFHRIRKTSASYFQARGGNAQRLLDHHDGETTQHYLDPRVIGEQQGADLLPAPRQSIARNSC